MGATEVIEPAAEARAESCDALDWTSHPARSEPRKAFLVAAVMVATGAAVTVAMGDAGWGFIALALLGLGVHDFLLPTRFRVDARGVTRRVLFFARTRPWSQIRSYWVDGAGVLVSPFPRRHRMEAHRGIYLRFDGNREVVVGFIERSLVERG